MVLQLLKFFTILELVTYKPVSYKIKNVYLPWADIGSAVSNICMAVFLGNALPIATAGVEQNNPILTLEMRKQVSSFTSNFFIRNRLCNAEDMQVCKDKKMTSIGK